MKPHMNTSQRKKRLADVRASITQLQGRLDNVVMSIKRQKSWSLKLGSN